MNLIQIVLILASLGSLLVYLVFFRTALRDRLIAVTIFGVSIISILFPAATTWVANILGVGRGADLLLYLWAAGTVFLFIVLYSKILVLERNQTELVRAVALGCATNPAERHTAREAAPSDRTGQSDGTEERR